MAKQKSKVRKTEPIGPDPKGSTRAIRGNPDKRLASDKPHEIPVYVTYQRHTTEDDLLGWTVALDAWMTSSRVEVKIGRIPYRLEVWVDGKRVHAANLKRSEGDSPSTVPDEEPVNLVDWFNAVDHPKSEGWVTKLGKLHAAEKAKDQRKNLPSKKPVKNPPGRISGDDIIHVDDDDDIEWED